MKFSYLILFTVLFTISLFSNDVADNFKYTGGIGISGLLQSQTWMEEVGNGPSITLLNGAGSNFPVYSTSVGVNFFLHMGEEIRIIQSGAIMYSLTYKEGNTEYNLINDANMNIIMQYLIGIGYSFLIMDKINLLIGGGIHINANFINVPYPRYPFPWTTSNLLGGIGLNSLFELKLSENIGIFVELTGVCDLINFNDPGGLADYVGPGFDGRLAFGCDFF